MEDAAAIPSLRRGMMLRQRDSEAPVDADARNFEDVFVGVAHAPLAASRPRGSPKPFLGSRDSARASLRREFPEPSIRIVLLCWT